MSDYFGKSTYDLFREAEKCFKKGLFDQAADIFEFIISNRQDNDWIVERVHGYLGYIFLTLGQLEKGENHLKTALSFNENNDRYHYLLGVINAVRRNWKKAILEYQIALDIQPWNSEYINDLGSALVNDGDINKGIEYLNLAITICPNQSSLLEEISTAYLSLGDIQKARLYAGKAIEARPDNLMAWIVLKKTFEPESRLNLSGLN